MNIEDIKKEALKQIEKKYNTIPKENKNVISDEL